MKKTFPLPLLMLLSLSPALTAVAVAGEGRPSGYLSEEEVSEYMKLQHQYQSCLVRRSGEMAGDYEDVRKVVDAAMQKCEGQLEQLRTAMNEHQVPAGFIEAFLHNTLRRAVKQAIPQVMMMKAEQQP
ncbi:MAG: hypothetical protein D6786_10140 [Gammaproteobacteria bacterium]|nr:MAG: hypothetical protein D6786_10140 [Gammaproteobacteria bacterium]